jgi:SOS-response transcriptional repressor LexA
MAGGDGLTRLRDALASNLPPAPFVGAGFSVAVTGGMAEASWIGLLKDGIRECERVVSSLPAGWAGQMRDQLENTDTVNCIGIADQIVRRLREVGGGTGYDSWIQGAISRLRPGPGGEQMIAAVRKLARGKIILTTNYDTLIEDLAPRWKSVAWSNDHYRAAQRLPRVVVHLHGLPDDPGSIILGSADYERLETSINEIIGRSLFSAFSFIFIGCGSGLNDPHIGLLLKFVDRMYPLARPEDPGYRRPEESYLLVRGGELRQFHDYRLPSFIAPVAYGRTFKDLGPFLQLLAEGKTIDVSQDPDFYAQAGAGSRRGLIDLAGRAQRKLEDVQDALRRALHAMGQVEHRGAMPSGMSGWDYEDRRVVHEQLAASMTRPAENLLACSTQIIPPFTEASSYVGRLGAFDAYPDDLELLRQKVSDLAGQTDLLLDRARKACDDLGERVDRYSSGYQQPCRTLVSARGFVEQAHDIAATLAADLTEPTDAPGSDKPPPVQLMPGTTKLSVTQPPEARLAAVRPSAATAEAEQAASAGTGTIPVLGKVAAGGAILVTGEFELLTVPARYADRKNVYALKVQGDSMIGDSIRDGDYIIVLAQQQMPESGDIVVVTVPSEDGGAGNGMVKRWRPQPGGSVLLESSNPAVTPISLTEDAWPAWVQGKVIGVVEGARS